MGKRSKRAFLTPVPDDLKPLLKPVKHITRRRVWDRDKKAMVLEEIAHYTPVKYAGRQR